MPVVFFDNVCRTSASASQIVSIQTREPTCDALKAPASRPSDPAQRPPHQVQDLGDQCQEEQIEKGIVVSQVRQQRGDRLEPSAESEAFSGAAFVGVSHRFSYLAS